MVKVSKLYLNKEDSTKMLNRQKCQSHHQLQDELDVSLLKHFCKVARALTGRRPVRPAADDDFDRKMP